MLLPAQLSDVPRMVEILFMAFAKDDLLVGTCYPDTKPNREWWEKAITTQMANPQTVALKVEMDGKLIAWAKWLVPIEDAEKVTGAVDPSQKPSPDMNMDACSKLAAGQYEMREDLFGKRDHLWLNAIATDPAYQRKGAATELVTWGVKEADRRGLECFSACTTQANQNMSTILREAGFEIVREEPVAKGLSVHAGYRKPKTG